MFGLAPKAAENPVQAPCPAAPLTMPGSGRPPIQTIGYEHFADL